MKDVKINTDMSFEEMHNMIQEYWYETELKDNIVVYSGIEGRVNFEKELRKQVGIVFTEEDINKFRQQLIDSGQTIFKL